MYLASYEIKVKGRNDWDTVEKNSNSYFSLGDCIAFLNSKYTNLFSEIYEGENSEIDNPNEKDIFFFWAISNAENSYAGVTELTSQNFLEKVIKIDLSEFRK